MIDEPRHVFVLELADRLMRSWWTVVAALCTGLAAAMVVLSHATPLYEAVSRLDLSAEKMPQGFFQDTVSGDEDPEMQLVRLRRNVLGDVYLDSIVEQEFGTSLSEGEREGLFRMIRGGTRVRRPAWTEHFEIRYLDTDPARAARITNALAQIYVEENLKFRVEGASGTVEALEQFAQQKWEEVQDRRTQIAEYEATHQLETEADRPMTIRQLTEARSELAKIQGQLQLLEGQIAMLEAQKTQTDLMDSYTLDLNPEKIDDTTALSILEAELRDLLGKYSENHPEVVKKRNEIEFQRGPASSDTSSSSSTPAAPTRQLDYRDIQIKVMNGELARLKKDEAKLLSEIPRFERRLAAIPLVAKQLDEWYGDLEILEGEYRGLRLDVEQAKRSMLVEESGKGTQFEIISYAGIPRVPVSPKPLPIYGVAVAAGLLLFVGPVVARALLVPSIGSEVRLAAASEVPVLVTIPAIATADTRRRTRRTWIRNSMLSVLAILTLAAVTGLRFAGVL